jgi:hypothetical protein
MLLSVRRWRGQLCKGDHVVERGTTCGTLRGGCHTLFCKQNLVVIVCVSQDHLFHTYGHKVFTDNQMSQIKYIYYINNVSKDQDNSRSGTS